MSSAKLELNRITFGAELELADIERRKAPLPGFGWDVRDVTMVNSNGIAVDPRGLLYAWGGEVNTPPAHSVEEQVALFKKLRKHYPTAAVNYRSNLHIHVRIPGLRDNLAALKKVQLFVAENLHTALGQIEPIPLPTYGEYPGKDELMGARARARRRKVSHQTILSDKRVAAQMAAKTVEEFFLAEFHQKSRKFAYIQPRAAVNLRQLTETDTVEFRHFPLSLNPAEYSAATSWCRDFLMLALEGGSIDALLRERQYQTKNFPKFMPYEHWMEERFQRTVRSSTNKPEQIAEQIARILKDDQKTHEETPLRPRGLHG